MLFLWVISAFLINMCTGYLGYRLDQKAQRGSLTTRALYWFFPWWAVFPFVGFGIVGVATFYGNISIQHPLAPFLGIASLFGFIAGTVLSDKTHPD